MSDSAQDRLAVLERRVAQLTARLEAEWARRLRLEHAMLMLLAIDAKPPLAERRAMEAVIRADLDREQRGTGT